MKELNNNGIRSEAADNAGEWAVSPKLNLKMNMLKLRTALNQVEGDDDEEAKDVEDEVEEFFNKMKLWKFREVVSDQLKVQLLANLALFSKWNSYKINEFLNFLKIKKK